MSKSLGWNAILLDAADNVRTSIRTTLLNRGSMELQELKNKLDMKAQQAIYNTLVDVGNPVHVISEEGDYNLGEGGPYLIADPIDGTTNLAKGIPLAVTSLAIANNQHLSDVHWAVIMDLYTGEIFRAEKNKGAWRGGKRIFTPSPKLIKDMLISIDISKGTHVEQFSDLINSVRYIRQLGCSAISICYVAAGLLDAYIDLRGTLRATDIAAALPILKEAGGIMELDGKISGNLKLKRDSQLSLIATTNSRIMEEIKKLL